MQEGSHPFPFRTRKLSPPWPMILGSRGPGKVGCCRIKIEGSVDLTGPFCSRQISLHKEVFQSFFARTDIKLDFPLLIAIILLGHMVKKDDSVERIRSCMLMESACAAVFHLLTLNFPRESELWSQMALDEEAHAEFIAKGMNFGDPENFTDFRVTPELQYIRQTVEYANEFKILLAKDRVSLKEAFEKVIRLLKMKNEGYLNDLLGKETEERVKKVFQRLFEIDKSGLQLVETAMTKYDFQKEKKE